MNFGTALDLLKEGHRVTRTGWNGKGMWIALQVPDQHSKMRRPYIYMNPVDGDLVPWVASQSDLLAWDWMLVAQASVQPADTAKKTPTKAPKKAGKASYGLKADGTPKRKPGRPRKASQPAPVQPAVESPQPAEAVTEVA